MDKPIFEIALKDCRWTLQEMSIEHIFPPPHLVLSTGPIVVSRMNDDSYFVHDGRHRCIRAILRGQLTIMAKNLY